MFRLDTDLATRFVPHWTRRAWLTHTATATAHITALTALVPHTWRSLGRLGAVAQRPIAWHPGVLDAARHAAQSERLDPNPLQALALQAIDAAKAAGAQYADARLTRVVIHNYSIVEKGDFWWDTEEIGLGVRVLVGGYWGFAASPIWTSAAAVRLARDAVGQAQGNAKGTPRSVDLGLVPAVTGTWSTPVRIDPFLIPVEEKRDAIMYWTSVIWGAGLTFLNQGRGVSNLRCARQERVVATSEGSLFTQTQYECGGHIEVVDPQINHSPAVLVHGLDVAGKGWELFLDAKFPEQMPQLDEEIHRQAEVGLKPATVGRYTVVCDGATMANLLDNTLGLATQLDRALGYEANAGGTSFIDDPLAMVGTIPMASPIVTVTANRSAPTQLATVRWDDEGVPPDDFTLVKDGVLVDFQTTREQAGWLAPYYQAHGRPVRSHGCAAAEDAHCITMQHMPNLALAPSPSAIRLEDLVADVQDGVLIEKGSVDCDFQARNGLLGGAMRKITNGRLGNAWRTGVIQFNTRDLWKQITAIGGQSTQAVVGTSCYDFFNVSDTNTKGQPAQRTSHSVQGVAATIVNQSLINPERIG